MIRSLQYNYKLGKLVRNSKYVGEQRKSHPLKIIFLETTLRCNLSCKHCGLSCGESLRGKEISAATIKKALKNIADSMDAKKIFIGFTGGEPLLRGDIFEIAKYINELGFSWGLVTNGLLVNEENIQMMKESGMSTVAVSLDGLEENHNWIRNNPKSFDKATDALRLFKKANFLNTVEAITSVSPRTLKELDKIYELVLSLGLDQWRIMPIAPVGRAGKDDLNLCLSPEEMIYVLEYIKNKRKQKKIKVTFNEMWFCGPEYEYDIRGHGFFCPAGVHSLAILSNGDISGCPLVEGLVEGNIAKDNVVELWDKKFKKYRDISWKKVGKCKECDWFELCNGEGMHLWKKPYKEVESCNYLAIKEYMAKQK